MNAIQCKHCGEVIESKYRHDWQCHSCPKIRELRGPEGLIFVDGGEDYQRVGGHQDDWKAVDG